MTVSKHRQRINAMSKEELISLRESICAKPENQNPPGSFYLYTATARRRLDEIDWAIASRIAQERLARGEELNCPGYSGRNSKRR